MLIKHYKTKPCFRHVTHTVEPQWQWFSCFMLAEPRPRSPFLSFTYRDSPSHHLLTSWTSNETEMSKSLATPILHFAQAAQLNNQPSVLHPFNCKLIGKKYVSFPWFVQTLLQTGLPTLIFFFLAQLLHLRGSCRLRGTALKSNTRQHCNPFRARQNVSCRNACHETVGIRVAA